MKKLLLIFLTFLLSISLVFIGRATKEPGYPLLQFGIEALPQCSGKHLDIEFPENTFMYERFGFYYDEDGIAFVAERCIAHQKHIQVQSFLIDEITSEDFELIEPGMSVYQVVALVGIPFASNTYGISTTDFKTDDGRIFRVHWTSDMKVLEESWEVFPRQD